MKKSDTYCTVLVFRCFDVIKYTYKRETSLSYDHPTTFFNNIFMVQCSYLAIGEPMAKTEPRYDRYPEHLATGERQRRRREICWYRFYRRGEMKILVCDDQIREVEEIMRLCRAYLANKNMEGTVEGTTDPFEATETDADVLVLDIEMPEANGIEIKDRLAREGRGPLIIFATHYADAMSRAFNTNVIGFLVKPVKLVELTLFMDTAAAHLSLNKRIYFDDGTSANTKDIVWLTANKGYSDFLLTDGTTKDGGRKSIKAWEEALSDYGFIRTDSGRLVNCAHVKGFWEGELLVGNVKVSEKAEAADVTTKISVRRRDDCKRKYIAYCQKMGKYT